MKNRIKWVGVFLLSMVTFIAPAVTISAFNYTGDWTDGLSVEWEGNPGGALGGTTEIAIEAPWIVAQMSDSAEDGQTYVNIVVFQAGVDLSYTWNSETGAFLFSDINVPIGWDEVHDFVYDTETQDGSLTYTFTPNGEVPPSVPDAGSNLGMLALALAGLGGWMKYRG